MFPLEEKPAPAGGGRLLGNLRPFSSGFLNLTGHFEAFPQELISSVALAAVYRGPMGPLLVQGLKASQTSGGKPRLCPHFRGGAAEARRGRRAGLVQRAAGRRSGRPLPRQLRPAGGLLICRPSSRSAFTERTGTNQKAVFYDLS